jgi:hypothetical protein
LLKIWTDKGTGSHKYCSVWSTMLPGVGFIARGDRNRPDKQEFLTIDPKKIQFVDEEKVRHHTDHETILSGRRMSIHRSNL